MSVNKVCFWAARMVQLEHCFASDMGPVDMSGNRPLSYTSLEGSTEQARQEYSKVGGVETV